MRATALLLATLLLCACGDKDEQIVDAAGTDIVTQAAPLTAPAAHSAAESPAVATGAHDKEPEPGQKTYEHYCGDCHDRGDGHPGTMRLAVRLDNPVLRTRIDLAPDYVKWVVRNGYQMMPPFRPTEINDAELEALASYVAAATIARSK